MIRMKDLMEEMCEEFPELTKDSIEKICRTGLMKTLSMTSHAEELFVNCRNNETVKFFFNCDPDRQFALTQENIKKYKYKDKIANEKKSS